MPMPPRPSRRPPSFRAPVRHRRTWVASTSGPRTPDGPFAPLMKTFSPTDAITDVPVVPRSTEPFGAVLGPDGMERFTAVLERTRAALSGRTLWEVNSTAQGGGVAELLSTVCPYFLGAGVDIRWVVLEGPPTFFEVTKRIHNRL